MHAHMETASFPLINNNNAKKVKVTQSTNHRFDESYQFEGIKLNIDGLLGTNHFKCPINCNVKLRFSLIMLTILN